MTLPVTRESLRVRVQRALDGAWLDHDLRMSGLEITKTLSGPQIISGRMDPEAPRDLQMDAYATWLHIEEAGNIQGSGIIKAGQIEGDARTYEAEGFSGYAYGIPYGGTLSVVGIDPLQVVRLIWNDIQSNPQSQLGVTVDPQTSPVRLGTEPVEEVEFEATDPENPEAPAEQVAFEKGGPYELLWYEAPNCGKEIEDLAKETPFDYREVDYWNDSRTQVRHHLQLGHPRLGRRHTAIRFEQGDNALNVLPLIEDEERYASEVLVLGAGSGSERIRGRAIQIVPNRLRRVVTIVDKEITSNARAQAFAERELHARQTTLNGVKAVLIDSESMTAPLGSFAVGDDVRVVADLPQIGEIDLWHRILSYTYIPDIQRIQVELDRSELFIH